MKAKVRAGSLELKDVQTQIEQNPFNATLHDREMQIKARSGREMEMGGARRKAEIENPMELQISLSSCSVKVQQELRVLNQV